MVLSKIIEWVQVLQRPVQRVGAPIDGGRDDRWFILNNSTLVACLTAVGTVVKEWSEFKKCSVKVDTCRFAYTTYAKALIELRTYGRGIPFDGLEGFLIKMQTLDDTIVDFTSPLPKRCVQEYRTQFVYQPIHVHCYAWERTSPTFVECWVLVGTRQKGSGNTQSHHHSFGIMSESEEPDPRDAPLAKRDTKEGVPGL